MQTSLFHYHYLRVPIPPQDGDIDGVFQPGKVQINRSVHYPEISQADPLNTSREGRIVKVDPGFGSSDC